MLSGTMLGVLTEQHTDHVVLDDSVRIPLAAGLIVKQFRSGTHVTVVYSYGDRGEIVIESIERSGIFTLPDIREERAS